MEISNNQAQPQSESAWAFFPHSSAPAKRIPPLRRTLPAHLHDLPRATISKATAETVTILYSRRDPRHRHGNFTKCGSVPLAVRTYFTPMPVRGVPRSKERPSVSNQ